MLKVSKKSRIHNKRSPGSTRGNTEANIKGKRKHTSGASVNASLHKPKGLISVSVDVFLEGLKIAAHCSPLDLLHLSRVSTDFRAVLLAKQNKSVWVVARNSLDPPMPSCPDDLSEPKYASLAFDQFCMICGTVPPKYKLDVSYASRIRLCKQCWKTNIKVGYTIIRELRVEPQIRRDRSLKRVILDLLPETSGCRGYATPDVVQQTPLHNLNFYQPDVAAAVKEYYTVVESSGGDSRILEEYVERRKARTLERLKFHSAVAKWGDDHARAQAEARAAWSSASGDVTCLACWPTIEPNPYATPHARICRLTGVVLAGHGLDSSILGPCV